MGELPIKPIVGEIEKILGFSLPDRAEVLATENGGIVAHTSNDLFGKTVIEISNKGERFVSSFCNDFSRDLYMVTYPFELRHSSQPPPTETVIKIPLCSDSRRVQQSGVVSQDKLRQARALLLSKGRVETAPKPAEEKKTAQSPTHSPAVAPPVAKK